jgi:hypothetical protein
VAVWRPVVNADRLICGVALPFGAPTQDNRGPWTEQAIQPWLSMQLGLDCRLDHGPILDRDSTIYTIGIARRFAVVTQPLHALLALIEIDEGRWGDAARGPCCVLGEE